MCDTCMYINYGYISLCVAIGLADSALGGHVLVAPAINYNLIQLTWLHNYLYEKHAHIIMLIKLLLHFHQQ